MDGYSVEELKNDKKKKRLGPLTSVDKLDFNIVYSRV